MQMLLTTVVSVELFMGCMVLNCDAITLTSQGSIDGNWTFIEAVVVTLTCKIPSYMGDMEWKFDSEIVAKCTPVTGCIQIRTGGEGSFKFGFDIANFIFLWTFTPVKSLHNGKVIECFDGTNTVNFTAIVKDKVTDSDNKKEPDISTEDAANLAVSAVVIASVDLCIIILLAVLCCNYKKKCNERCPKKCNLLCIEVYAWIQRKLHGLMQLGDLKTRMDSIEKSQKKIKQKLKTWNIPEGKKQSQSEHFPPDHTLDMFGTTSSSDEENDVTDVNSSNAVYSQNRVAQHKGGRGKKM